MYLSMFLYLSNIYKCHPWSPNTIRVPYGVSPHFSIFHFLCVYFTVWHVASLNCTAQQHIFNGLCNLPIRMPIGAKNLKGYFLYFTTWALFDHLLT